jgi:putative transposase
MTETMARMARVVVPGCPHHVVQRGNRRLAVFLDEHDLRIFLTMLWEVCAKYGVQICAYCLITNHIHLIAIPSTAASLSQAMHELYGRYAIHFNERHGLIGRLWQGRFRSSPMDEPHFWAAVRYVERNPVRAGMVARAEHYPWSSAPAHCGLAHELSVANSHSSSFSGSHGPDFGGPGF